MQLDRDVPLEDGDWVDVNPQDTEVWESEKLGSELTVPIMSYVTACLLVHLHGCIACS